uniref:Mos1 transposase HTH domain-containing protein n=1 Tax=Rhodnius prolixus TaxID=13249 RepID=T1HN77_RHOPR
MDEKEFRVLIKHYFMKGKTPQETKEKLDKHYGDSALRLEQFISGFKIFGVAIWAQVTLNVLDALSNVFWDSQGIILIDYLEKG